MNLSRSLTNFARICQEDGVFRMLGRPLGWSVYFHYLGRWYDRRRREMPARSLTFLHRGRKLKLAMTDKYLGAFKGVFVDHEYNCRAEFPTFPRRILDLGGNIGFGTIYLAGLFPDARIAVVEPDPRNLLLLRKNLEINSVNAQIIQAAAGPTAGSMALRFGENPTCSSLAGTGMHDLANAVEVDVTTVPKLLDQMGWDSIDLIKIDIEGAEEELLARNNTWLARTGAIIVEIHPNTTVERLNGYLSPFGFALQRFGSGREPVYFAQRKQACGSW